MAKKRLDEPIPKVSNPTPLKHEHRFGQGYTTIEHGRRTKLTQPCLDMRCQYAKETAL